MQHAGQYEAESWCKTGGLCPQSLCQSCWCQIVHEVMHKVLQPAPARLLRASFNSGSASSTSWTMSSPNTGCRSRPCRPLDQQSDVQHVHEPPTLSRRALQAAQSQLKTPHSLHPCSNDSWTLEVGMSGPGPASQRQYLEDASRLHGPCSGQLWPGSSAPGCGLRSRLWPRPPQE